MINDLIKPFKDSLEALDRVGAEHVFQQALAHMTPIQAVEQVVVPALEQIGAAWEEGRVALSQVYSQLAMPVMGIALRCRKWQ